jgi:hypothetical protein
MVVLRWNGVLVTLAVLLALDAILIMTRDVQSSTSRESLMQEAGILPSRMEAHVHLGKKKTKGHLAKKTKRYPDEQPIDEVPDESQSNEVHKVADLKCEAYGGPSREDAAEMIYWQDIPSDAAYVSPLKAAGPETKYLTFEPDEGEFQGRVLRRGEAFVTLKLTVSSFLYRWLEQHSYGHGNCCDAGTCYGAYSRYAPGTGHVLVRKG